jgi:hypothetical protein
MMETLAGVLPFPPRLAEAKLGSRAAVMGTIVLGLHETFTRSVVNQLP